MRMPSTNRFAATLAFAVCAASSAALASGPPSVIGVTSPDPSGWSQTFTLTYSDPVAATNLYSSQIIISNPVEVYNSCYLYVAFDSGSTRIYLVDDTGGTYGPVWAGNPDVLQNSQCAVYAAGTSVLKSGTTLTLTLALSFKSGYVGTRNFWVSVCNDVANTDGTIVGSWNVTTPPAPDFSIGVTPVSNTVVSGGSATYNVSTSFTNLPGAAVAYSVPSGLPAGASAAFNPSSITVSRAAYSATQIMTITTTSGTPVGSSTPVVSATGGGLTRTASTSLIVQGAPPAITSLSPTSGAPGTPVTITGTNFGATQGGSTVTFNGTAATPTTWSATSIQAPVPANATTGNVVVTVGGVASPPYAFTVSPSITTIAPNPALVGTSVMITGKNFGATQGGSTVTFNGTAAIPTSWSATSITAPVPAGATTGNVVVTVASAASAPYPFTVGPPPSVTGILPSPAPVGTAVTITGANFGATQSGSTVTFNGAAATPTGWSATSIAVPVPANATTGNVVVTVGTASSAPYPFTVSPSITTILPNPAPVGTPLTITGKNFGATQGGSTVTFNGTPATPAAWSATSITVPVPANTTTGNVVVTVGAAPSAPYAFTVSPSIATIVPNPAPLGTPVTITGSNFGATQGGSTVTFNGVAATPTTWSATSITVPVPANAATGNVVVTVGGAASTPYLFTVNPSITSIVPNPAAVGTPVIITGASFGATQGASTVTFNGTLASPTAWSATNITVPVPANATTGDVIVTIAGQASNHVSFGVTGPPTSAWTDPLPNSGHRRVFTFTFTDAFSQASIGQFLVKFGTSADEGAHTCWMLMDHSNIYFYDDDGHQTPPVPFGSSTLLQNHQCSVYPWESTVTPAGAPGLTATLRLSMEFIGTYAGQKDVWLTASNGASLPWASKGTYTVTNQLPSVGSFVMPGSAWNQTFTFHYTDPDGASDFANVQVQFNSGADPWTYCFMVVDGAKHIYLADDVTGEAKDPITAGLTGHVQNKYCSVDGGTSNLEPEGSNGWKLTLAMGFTTDYSGPRRVYTMATDWAMMNSGWVDLGPYTVPSVGTTYNISGRVTASGAGMSGVNVDLSGTQNGMTTTDASGYYSFSGVAAGGNYTISVWKSGSTFYPGVDSTTNLQSNWTVTTLMAVVPDFTMSLNSTPLATVVAGGSATYTLSVTPTAGFTGTINLSATSPSGATVTPGQIAVSGPDVITVNVTITVPSSTASGNTTVTLSGSFGTATHTASAPLKVETFDFTVAPTPLNIEVGNMGTFTITVTGSTNFDKQVDLYFYKDECDHLNDVTGHHNLGTWNWGPALPGPGSTTFNIAGPYPWSYGNCRFTATAGGVKKQQFVAINVTSGPVTATIIPSSATLRAGQSQFFSANTNVTWTLNQGALGHLSGFGPSSVVYVAPISIAGSATDTLTATPGSGTSGSATIALQPQSLSPPISVSPSSQTVIPTGIAGYTVSVNSSAGLSGTVSFAASGLPAGATQSFSPTTVNGSGTTALTIATSASSPAGAFPITITASSALAGLTTTAFLLVSGPSPATMISPGSGTILTSTPVTFLWKPGAGASQHQLAVGSACGGSEYYSASTGSSATAYCPDGTLQCQSATANSIPVSLPVHDLCARLSTLVSGAWQHIDYPYQAGPVPPGGMANSIGLQYSTVYYVYNDGKPSEPRKYKLCDSNSPAGQCNNTGNWQGGLVGDTCQVTLNMGGAADDSISVQVTAKGKATSSGTDNSMEVTFTAAAVAVPGAMRDATCSYNGNPLNPIGFFVYDATPHIYTDEAGNTTGVIQYPPSDPGGPFYVEVYGNAFGLTKGSMNICAQNADPCRTDPDNFGVDITYWNVNADGSSQMNALITPSATLAAATYDVQLTSRGASGYFAAAPAQGSKSQSNRGQITPVPPVCTVCKISGHVTANDGKSTPGNFQPMGGVTITLSQTQGLTQTTTTNEDGYYEFTVTAGNTVTISPKYQFYQLPYTAQYPGNPSMCQGNPILCTFSNIRANQTQDFTTTFTTVFLLHGIGQRSADMQHLWQSLTGSSGVDLTRFVVDYGFDFSDCTASVYCDWISCSLTNGGSRLAQYVASEPGGKAPADIILVGYSLGGLVARDMLEKTASYPPLARHTIRGLITLGTPHWGYAYLESVDNTQLCPRNVYDMAGSWNPSTDAPNPLSPFLSSLKQSWKASTYGGYWLAAAGRYCNNPIRNFSPVEQPTGCRTANPRSDGTVCMDSAIYSANTQPAPIGAPTITWTDPDAVYVHTRTFGQALIYGCPNTSANPQLFDPPNGDGLFQNIVSLINGLH